MRFFLKSVFAIVAAAFVAGALTYPAWLLVSQFADYRPDRIMRRIGSVLLVVALIWVLRREKLSDRATYGYDIPRALFLRQLALGFGAGLALMLLLSALFFAVDVRVLRADLTAGSITKAFLTATIAAFVIAFAEETFMRGAMFSVIKRESGIPLAIILPSLLFAAAHFMVDPEKMRGLDANMSFVRGLEIAARAFADFAEPLAHIDAFAALFALGVLLSLIRLRTGAIAGAVGVHAGGVTVIMTIGKLSLLDPASRNAWAIGSYNNGMIGWVACAWIAVVGVAYWLLSALREQRRLEPP